MDRNVPNSDGIRPNSHEIKEIVHIADSERRNRTLCGTKSKNLVKAEPDCIVCIDILEYRLGLKDGEESDD